MEFMKYLDPMYWLGEEGYAELSQKVIELVFNGYGARILSGVLLFLGLWFMFRRKMTSSGMVFLGLSSLVVFASGIYNYFKNIW